MPSTNTTLGTHPPQAVQQTIPAPAGRTVAEDKLWAAVRAHSGATTGELAAHAGIGRSTAGKILAAWATEGSVTRTCHPGSGGRRAADTWEIFDTTRDHLTESTTVDQPDAEPTGAPPATPGELGGGEITLRDPGAEEPPTAPATPTDTTAPEDTPAPGRTGRLGKGALRGMVEDYLTGRAGEQLSPSAIGTALGRSSGAVANALDKLVADGYAVQTQDKPKRYATTATPEPATG
jgi:biotin operon repressor